MKKKILIVDDDPTIMSFLKPLLSKKNYDAVHAKDGNDAFKKITSEIPDLVISDIMMPGMDGFELYQRLRKDPQTEKIPFVFLSSKDDPKDQLKGLRMGADEYLTKPFNVTKLFVTIKNVLANAERNKHSDKRIDFSGNLAEINLEDIVQIVEMNMKTGELLFTTHEDISIGSVFFKEGAIIDANTGHLEGEEAFYDLSTNKNAYVKFYSRKIDVPEMISSQNMTLLFEAARLIDDGKTLYTLIDDMDALFSIKSLKVPHQLKESVDGKWISKILKMIGQAQTLRKIINSGEMSRSRAENVLVEMINADMILLK